MPTFIQLGLLIFVIAWMVGRMHGPFGWCEYFRNFVRNTYCHGPKQEWLYHGVQCPICLGFWISSGFALYFGPFDAYSAWGVTAVVHLFFKGWVPADPVVSYEENPAYADDAVDQG